MITNGWKLTLGFACSVLLAISAMAEEKFPRPNLLQLIAGADAAVTGQIAELRKGTFVLKLEQVQLLGTKGPLADGIAAELKVGQAIEIPHSRPVCSARQFNYAVDQRLIILVKKEKGSWSSICGCDGESLIEEEDVLCGFAMPNPRAELTGRPPKPRVKLADLQAAIADFPHVFRASVYRNLPPELAQLGTGSNDLKVTLIGSAREQQAFAKRSRVHKLLLDQAGK
ncbi:hypothetical protein [Anatilimnocola floriformis]|uniref:hypothetical protein n=1 Tax=Anatilimnocola floriformis TaxID=2948575 RepID=UPI0020C5AF63|nr:hypothetical protein [Anatilimnocola floriformis]